MGRLVVIEGLDGSGKATQTALLADALAEKGVDARKVTFPDYKSNSSTLVRMYLGGEFGTKPDDVNAFAASSFYAVDRFASYKKDWGAYYDGGGLILADRYTASNSIHQCAKLPKEQWKGFNDWLYDYEYTRMQIPRPDLIICLDVEPEVSQNLLNVRYGGKDKKDIHEQDVAYLHKCHEAAHWCAAEYGWRLIGCTEGGAMRSREAIARDVLAVVLPVLG